MTDKNGNANHGMYTLKNGPVARFGNSENQGINNISEVIKMKQHKAIILSLGFVILALVGCGSRETPKANQEVKAIKLKTVEEVTSAMKLKIPQMENLIVVTEGSDPNLLMGRPNQYTSRINFADTRIKQPEDQTNNSDPAVKPDPLGGKVEYFANAADAKARKVYIDEIGKSMPMMVEYTYLNNNALLRLDKELTPDQAAEYAKIFNELKIE